MAIPTGYNCFTSRFGTGMESCQAVEGLPTGFILVPKGWSLNRTTDSFNQVYVDTQIQLGNFIPFIGAFEVTSNTPDPTTQESQSGITSVVRQGKPTFTAIFKKGLAFQNAAFTYNSDNQYDALIVYDTGFIKCVVSPDFTTIKGLSIGMLNTNGYTENTGAASSQTTMMFQIVNPLEYNQYAFLLTSLDFDPQTKDGVVNTLLSTVDLPVLADASDNKANFPIVWKANEKLNIAGFGTTSTRFVLNGVVLTPTAVTFNQATSKWEATFASGALVTGQTLVITLWDSVNARANAKIGAKFYQGAVSTVVVA